MNQRNQTVNSKELTPFISFFMKFLDYSRASAAETVSHSYVAIDQHYINEEELELVKQQADIVWRKVNNFIAYLNKSAQKQTNKTNRTNVTD